MDAGTHHASSHQAGARRGGERRHLVLVAYYFPPLGGSGVQRVTKWAKYLPRNGWDVTVLTAAPGAYFAYDDSLLNEVEDAGVRIIRTGSFDPTRVLSARKAIRLPSERRRKLFTWLTGLFFVPDNKRGWRRHARKAFKQMDQLPRVDAVLSSAPPYTSLMVGADLATYLGVPHIVDYRDDWLDNPRHRYPTPLHVKWHRRLEKRVVSKAASVLTINASIGNLIKRRHPGSPVTVLPHGFDPEDFHRGVHEAQEDRPAGPMRLVYSGMFYDAQQPDTMLRAISLLQERNPNLSSSLEVRFVGLFPEEKRSLIEELGLEELVVETGYQDHRSAVREIVTADVLWMTVGRQPGEHMISTSKLHEYMGTGKPVLALAPDGEVRTALSGYGASWTVDPDDVGETATVIASLLQKHQSGELPRGDDTWILQFNRKAQTAELGRLLDKLTSTR